MEDETKQQHVKYIQLKGVKWKMNVLWARGTIWDEVKTEGETGHECKLEKVRFERHSDGFSLQWGEAAASCDSAVKAEFWTTPCCVWKMQQILPKMLAKHGTGFPGSAGINQSVHELKWMESRSRWQVSAPWHLMALPQVIPAILRTLRGLSSAWWGMLAKQV